MKPGASDACLERPSGPAARFVRDTFVLPVHDVDTGIRVDFIFSTTPYERQAIERAVIVELGGEPVPFASAEDLVIVRLGSRTRAHARASQRASSGTRGNRLTHRARGYISCARRDSTPRPEWSDGRRIEIASPSERLR